MKDKNLCKMCSVGKVMFLIGSVFVLLISIFSCDSEKAGVFEHPGLLQFGLSADTAGIQGSQVLTKAVLPDLTPYLNTNLYKIEILQGEEETVVSSFEHYEDMPDLVELERGNYRIRASMGELKAAAFEAPRFEGVSDFIIKENMTTKLDVTCSLANARVTVAYTDSFKVVYPTYTLGIETSHTTEPFEFVQDEARSGWFQVNTEGEDLKGILTVKPDTGEVKQFTVTIPSVKPKDNVMLTFNSTPNTRPDQGLTVKVTINEETEEKPVYVYIPDYMLPVDAALLEAHGFAHADPIVLGASDVVTEANVKMYVPGTIENCKLSIWEDEGKAMEYDLAHLSDGEKMNLTAKGFNLPEIWHKKQVTLDFKPVVEKLPRIEEGKTEVKQYNYQLIVTDSLVNPHVSRPLTLSVKMIPDVAPKILFSDGFISSQVIRVTEGGIVYSDGIKNDSEFKATIKSSTTLSACMLKITDATGTSREYNLLAGESVAGVKYDLSASTPYVNLKELISALVLDDDNIKRYEYELTVRTEFDGSTYEDVKTFIVDLIPPKFEMSMNGDTEENGDAFAKRAVLRAKTTTGDAEKLSFQLYEDGQWKDLTKERIDGEVSIKEDVASAVVTGLKPETQYRVRAKYGKHISGEMTFTTEKEVYLPANISGIEDWYSENGNGGKWKKWYPYNQGETNPAWNTLNPKTTSPNSKYAYASSSGTLQASGSDAVSGYSALLQTIAWGSGVTAAGSASAGNVNDHNVDPGFLYLGKYNENPGYTLGDGYSFESKPYGVYFSYKYYPYKSDEQFTVEVVVANDDEILGRCIKTIGGRQEEFKMDEVIINYNWFKKLSKATHVYILVKSGEVVGSKSSNVNLVFDASIFSSGSVHIGSKLYIDNIQLKYE